MKSSIALIPVFLILAVAACTPPDHADAAKPEQEKWIPLFNGKDLTGWTPKFAGYPLGENPNNVFRVEDGLLKVSYEDSTEFKGDFGHLFYKTPYSHYRIRATFRFTGEQLTGGPEWAYRNNGFMLHCEDPKTMDVDRKFPASIEVQFKGNNPEKGPKNTGRTMGALFTPGTNATVNGEQVQTSQTSSPIFEGTDWCTAEVEVHGQNEMIHYVNGEEVLRTTNFKLNDGTPLGSGYIAIQAETHPTEFKSIEIQPITPPSPEENTNLTPEGYTSLFDGKTLDGWKVHPQSVGHWKVVGGAIDYDAQSEAPRNEKHLWTEKDYGDFELHVDWRIKETHGLYPMPVILPDGSYKKDENGEVIKNPTPNADSGILLRGQLKSQCNIWVWPVGSGEVYGYRMDKKMPPEVRAAVTPKKRADNPVGQWNTFIITMKGDLLTVKLNGETVIENAQLPGIPEEGPIGLQHHGGLEENGEFNNASSLVQFRNIYLKEL